MDDYTNEQMTSQTQASENIHLPLALIAFAFAVFLFAQISSLGQNARSMKWQAENLDRQITSLADSEKNLTELVKQRESLVQQSQQVQARYTELLSDLINLADTDPDARAVVDKYKIQRQQNAPASESEAKPQATP
jgi:flagellar biosynthesis/type III secretory pathway M-ring protein FliF/YscJ